MNEQPPAPPLTPPAPLPPANQPAPNPGQATGIISLILAFVGLAPFGLVLSIISTVQSKKAKASTVLGVIGIVINLVAVLTFIFLILVISISYQGAQSRTKEASARSHAAILTQHAEAYYAAHQAYPQSISDFNKDHASSLTGTSFNVTSVAPTDTNSVMYKPCGLTGAEIVYFSSTQNIPVTSYLGDGNAVSCLDKQSTTHAT